MQEWDGWHVRTMDLRDLKCFILTAELGSITRAAGELGLVQSALSRKVQAIEEELGCTLFNRLPRGIQLTPAGRRFLDRARRIVREVDFARSDVKDGAGEVAGAVSLGLSPTLAPLLAPDCLAQVATDFPGIQLKVVEGFSSSLLDLLLTGRIDLAVLTNPPRTPMLQQEPAASEEILVITPPGARGIQPYVTLDELCNEPVVVTSGLRTVIEDQLRKHGRALNVSTGHLYPGSIVDRREPDEKMTGIPMTRVGSDDASWAYTLYSRPSGGPFVHALHTTAREASCIDVPIGANDNDLSHVRMRLREGSLELRVRGRTLATIDTRTFEVRR